MAGSMKLLFRPCTVAAAAARLQPRRVGQAKKAFLLHISMSRKVFLRQGVQWISQQQQQEVAVSKSEGLRCYSSAGDSSHHHVNDAGSIDSSLMQSMENKIREQLSAESVVVNDAYGDGRHVSIDVVSSAFEGKSAVNRQRMVYKAIWEELQTTVHAVDQMTTRTPSEAGMDK